MSGLHALHALATETPAVPGITANFSQDNGWTYLVKAVLILVFLLTSVLFAIWFERKVVARMQVRPGPNWHGPFGLLQSLADAMKLLLQGGHHRQGGRQVRLPARADDLRVLRAPSCSRSSRSGPRCRSRSRTT